ncbi:MAG TPA: FHA domain-containing protein [Anaerolineae bacterium]|nr:FHA domain-containing protein [Anaerolineae bacterium]
MSLTLIGRTIDKYRIDKQLGEGGMGAVFEAFHMTLQRRVAFKIVHPHLASQAQFQQRFLNEAQTVAKLDHPSIVKVYDAGFSDGILFIAMEYIEGGTLSQHIKSFTQKKKAFKLREGLFILAQAADALDYAHHRPEKIIHRDIKPDNIMLRKLDVPDAPGEPPLRTVITDFGLAKAALGPDGGTMTGSFLGTPAYMSPEQCRGQTLDGRSDIYSLGIVLYQIATGRLPFMIRTPAEAVTKHLFETPPPADQVRPGLPAAVVQIINRALAKESGARFGRAKQMADALRQVAHQLADDETQSVYFTPARPSESIVTQVESFAHAPSVAAGFSRVQAGARDQIVITRAGVPPQTVVVNKPSLTIGRTPDNDVQLDLEKISRHHARIDQTPDGYSVTDLGSTNGTMLDANRLLEGVPQSWESGQTLRIGNCFLRWTMGQQASVPMASMQQTPYPQQMGAGRQPYASAFTASAFDSMQTPLGASRLQSSGGRIGVVVKPTELRVEPGQRETLQVQIFNRGMTVDHFDLSMSGLNREWYSLPQESVELMPGAQGALTVLLHPPRSSSTTAGDHKFKLTVRAQSDQEAAAAKANLHVLPFVAFSAELHPSIIEHKKSARLSINNESNHPTTFAIEASDPAATIRFGGVPPSIEVDAGAAVTREIKISARKRHWLGMKKSMPYAIAVTPMDGQGVAIPQRKNGQMSVKPIIPRWVVRGVGMLLTLGLLAGAFLYTRITNEQKAEIATQTAVAEAGANSAEQTRQAADANAAATKVAADAALATAAAEGTKSAEAAQLAGDDDGDGLSNQQELALGTEPDNPDTDQDGLSDGQEVNIFSTQPKNQDSDTDGMLDGLEVQNGTQPLNPDTDGDGLPDGIDDDPLVPALPTPNVPATQAAIAAAAALEAANAEATQTAIAEAALSSADATATQVSIDTTTEAVKAAVAATETAIAQAVTVAPPGLWEGVWASQCDVILCEKMEIRQSGNEIEGVFANGNGKLIGEVEGNFASGKWSLGGADGSFDFWLNEDGKSWNGNWNKTFGWCGGRSNSDVPASCGVASWYGQWKTACGTGDCEVMEIIQTGEKIFGTYANSEGIIEGTVQGTALTGSWNRNGGSGTIGYYMLPDGEQFNGNWNTDFEWCGGRSGNGLPDPCLNSGFVVFTPVELVIDPVFVDPEPAEPILGEPPILIVEP